MSASSAIRAALRTATCALAAWSLVAGASEPAAPAPAPLPPAAGAPDALALAAARTFAALDTLDVGEEPSPDAAAMLRDIAWEGGEFAVQAIFERDRHDALVSFPSALPRGDPRNDIVWLEWFFARGDAPGRAPAVVILHILHGGMELERGIAAACALRGVHAFVMHMPDYGLRGDRAARRDPLRFVQRGRQAIADARRARDAVAALPGVDGRRVSIQGISLGGFVAAAAAALDRSFPAVHVLLAGGDLPELMRHGQRDAARIRAAFQEAGLSDAEIAAQLRRIDPLRLAHRLDPRRTWLYSATFDEVVPARCALALARAAGLDGEHHVWLPGNHYSCAPFLPGVLHDMVGRVLAAR